MIFCEWQRFSPDLHSLPETRDVIHKSITFLAALLYHTALQWQDGFEFKEQMKTFLCSHCAEICGFSFWV